MNCKTCLCDLNTVETFMSLSAKDVNTNITLMEKLIQCVPEMNLVGTNEDFVCPNCYILLMSAYNFRIMCLESAKKLIDTYGSSKSALEEVKLSDDELIQKACNEIPELKGDPDEVDCKVSLTLLPEKVINVTMKKENVFICDYCNTIFQSRRNLLVHMTEHFKNNEYIGTKCKRCNINFRSVKIFEIHMKLHPQMYGTYTLGDENARMYKLTNKNETNITLRPEISRDPKTSTRNSGSPVNVNTSTTTLEDVSTHPIKKSELEFLADIVQRTTSQISSTPGEKSFCKVNNKSISSRFDHTITDLHKQIEKNFRSLMNTNEPNIVVRPEISNEPGTSTTSSGSPVNVNSSTTPLEDVSSHPIKKSELEILADVEQKITSQIPSTPRIQFFCKVCNKSIASRFDRHMITNMHKQNEKNFRRVLKVTNSTTSHPSKIGKIENSADVAQKPSSEMNLHLPKPAKNHCNVCNKSIVSSINRHVATITHKQNMAIHKRPVKINSLRTILELDSDGVSKHPGKKIKNLTDVPETTSKVTKLPVQENTAYCPLCQINIVRPERHLASKRHKIREKCAFCFMPFTDATNVLHHYRSHSNTDNYCHNCNKRFSSIIKLALHTIDSDCCRQSPYDINCPICEKNMRTRNELKRHVFSIHKRVFLPITCKICLVSLGSIAAILNHPQKCKPVEVKLKANTEKLNTPDIVCPICKETLPGIKNRLKCHLYEMHRNIPLPRECETCSVELGSIFSIYEHKCYNFQDCTNIDDEEANFTERFESDPLFIEDSEPLLENDIHTFHTKLDLVEDEIDETVDTRTIGAVVPSCSPPNCINDNVGNIKRP